MRVEEMKPRTHEPRHGFYCDFGSLERRKAHKKRARKSEKNIGDIVKLAQLNGMSYGQAVARLKEGKL